MPRAAWHCGGNCCAANDPLEVPASNPLYLCLPPIWALQVVTVISPLLVGPKMESSIVKDKKSKRRDSVVQRHLLKFAQQGASQSGEPPQ